MIKHIMFDLDGTLIDTQKGILSTLKDVLFFFKVNENNETIDKSIIGPRIKDILKSKYNFSEERALIGENLFLKIYRDKYLYTCNPFIGIENILHLLKKNQYSLYVISNKKTKDCIDILSFFKLQQYFKIICGRDFCDYDDSKYNNIISVMNKFNITSKDCIYIGDSLSDYLVSNKLNIYFIGVLYGYGSKQLTENRSNMSNYHFVESCIDLQQYIFQHTNSSN